MIKEIEVFLSAGSFDEEELRGKTAVVIDVLRASSTIATAIYNNAKGVIPVASTADANKIIQSLNSTDYLLCGERDGVKIEGYDLGNSPLDYTPDTVGGKTIIINTTNGTKALMRCSPAAEVMIGCFLNMNSLTEILRQKEEVVLICSGWRGRLSFEDLLCAGNIIYELTEGVLPGNARDGAKVAVALYEKFGKDLEGAVRNSNHASRLKGIVEVEDISFCCNVNTMDVLPIMNEGMITDFHGKKT